MTYTRTFGALAELSFYREKYQTGVSLSWCGLVQKVNRHRYGTTARVLPRIPGTRLSICVSYLAAPIPVAVDIDLSVLSKEFCSPSR